MLRAGEGAAALGDSIVSGLIQNIAATDDPFENRGTGCVGSHDVVMQCRRCVVGAPTIGTGV